jgi:hypothetical protein
MSLDDEQRTSTADATPPPAVPPSPPSRQTEDDDDQGTIAAIVEAATGPVRSIARPVRSVARSTGRGVGRIRAGAQRSIRDAPGQHVRRIRRMGREPLTELYQRYPDARKAFPRTLGLLTVPLDAIRGTAVEGPTQRGGDFLPLKQLRGADWQARWQRIRQALDQLIDLPPVELMRYGDEYWVVDGHNRVAAALYNGQVAIDALVTELRPPGGGARRAGPIAAYLGGSMDLRAAGEGKLTRTATRPSDWEVLPDAVAGGRGGADAGDDRPVDDQAASEAGPRRTQRRRNNSSPPSVAPPATGTDEPDTAGGT